jgi:hypothetical protein
MSNGVSKPRKLQGGSRQGLRQFFELKLARVAASLKIFKNLALSSAKNR